MKTYRSILAVTASALVIATAGFALAHGDGDGDGKRGGGDRAAHAAQHGGEHRGMGMRGGDRGERGVSGDDDAGGRVRGVANVDDDGHRAPRTHDKRVQLVEGIGRR